MTSAITPILVLLGIVGGMVALFVTWQRLQLRKRMQCWVWQTQEVLSKHFAASVLAMLAKGERVLVVTHFSETQQDILLALEQAGLRCEKVESLQTAMAYTGSSNDRVFWIEGETLERHVPQPTSGASVMHPLTVLVPELHPLPDRRLLLEAQIKKAPKGSTLLLWSAIDSAMFRYMGSGSTDTTGLFRMMESMGMEEDEPLNSSIFVSLTLTLQQRAKSRHAGHTNASSALDWYQRSFGEPPAR